MAASSADERRGLADEHQATRHQELFERYARVRACRQRLTLAREHVTRPGPLPGGGIRYGSRAESVPAP